ncbi:hypothetical protein BD779DRAFT_1517677 [Infundibulicybe gibba]|nr:hypothetical protein BD779DRAFT_1517677 [Infundibulicybe gibba]
MGGEGSMREAGATQEVPRSDTAQWARPGNNKGAHPGGRRSKQCGDQSGEFHGGDKYRGARTYWASFSGWLLGDKPAGRRARTELLLRTRGAVSWVG